MGYNILCGDPQDARMLRFAIGLFLILLPVLELALLVKLGQEIGVWLTLALLVAAFFLGVAVISQQSTKVLRQTLEAMSEGRAPAASVLDGVFLLTAGGLLLMPGLISDALAFLLLVPPLRHAIARWSMRHALYRVDLHYRDEGDPRTGRAQGSSQGRASGHDGPIIEGEFERLNETSAEPQPPSQRHLR
jgi:UPF0716 protein FxsA